MLHLILLQIIVFCIGSIILILSGKQDEKTRRPWLIIPGLILIGLSTNLITFITILIASILFFLAPKKTNYFMGKADLLLFTSILLIFILGNNPIISTILWFTLLLTTLSIYKQMKQTKKQTTIPLIYYFTTNYSKIILLTILITTVFLILKTIIGVV